MDEQTDSCLSTIRYNKEIYFIKLQLMFEFLLFLSQVGKNIDN